MYAQETKEDWTTADGTETFTLYKAPPGWKVLQIRNTTEDSISYKDSNHKDDVFERGGDGPVRRFVVVGDTGEDNDAGDRTGVTVDFNPLRVQIQKTTDCQVPSAPAPAPPPPKLKVVLDPSPTFEKEVQYTVKAVDENDQPVDGAAVRVANEDKGTTPATFNFTFRSDKRTIVTVSKQGFQDGVLVIGDTDKICAETQAALEATQSDVKALQEELQNAAPGEKAAIISQIKRLSQSITRLKAQLVSNDCGH
jgi:hypothetical protein